MYFETRERQSPELVTTKFELGAVAGVLFLGLMSLLVAGSMIAGAVVVTAVFAAVVTVAALRYS